MDCSESISGLGSVEHDEGTLLESMKVSDSHKPEDAFSAMEPEAQHLTNTNGISTSISIEDSDVDRSPAGTSTATKYNGHGEAPGRSVGRGVGFVRLTYPDDLDNKQALLWCLDTI